MKLKKNEELPYFVEDISHFTNEEALFVIEDYCNQIVEKTTIITTLKTGIAF